MNTPTKGERTALVWIWVAFLVRGIFYCSVFPLWEGFDEWSHYAFVQHFRIHATLPDSFTTVSAEIRESLKLTPLPWELRNWPSPHAVHDVYWSLPAGERERRHRELENLEWNLAAVPAAQPLAIYEAQQPPLYYWLAAVLDGIASNANLKTRVMILRLVGILLTSVAIPLLYFAAKLVWHDRRIALGLCALLAAMPGFLIDVARAGNECLGVTCCSLVVGAALVALRRPESIGVHAALGCLLGLALLAKAYALAFVPLPALLAVLQSARAKGLRKKIWTNLCGVWIVALAVSGWWYIRAWSLTGTISGEQIDAASRRLGWTEKLTQAANVNWLSAIDSASFSHIWWGNWSFLNLRSWMYHVFQAVVIAAVLGLVVLLAKALQRWRRGRPLGWFTAQFFLLVSAYTLLCVGLAYRVLAVFVAYGLSTTMGWYLYSVVVIEILLMTLGLQAILGRKRLPHAIVAGVASMTVLDVYATNFLLIPYYSGVTAHRLNGGLSAFHLNGLRRIPLSEIMARVASVSPAQLNAPTFTLVWLLYLMSTIGLAAFAARLLLRSKQRSGELPEV
jgi:hypothetical protein